MRLQSALQLVLELAEQNALADADADAPELKREQTRQTKAIAKVRKLLWLMMEVE